MSLLEYRRFYITTYRSWFGHAESLNHTNALSGTTNYQELLTYAGAAD